MYFMIMYLYIALSLTEEAQRRSAKERKAKMLEWNPRLFERDEITGDWIYKYAEWVMVVHKSHFIVYFMEVVVEVFGM